MIKTLQEYTKYMTLLYKMSFNFAFAIKEEPYYRIVKTPDEGDKRVFFQMVNKKVIIKMLPEEIMRDDLLLGFSRAEIAILVHLGTKNEVSTESIKFQNKIFKIIKQIFSGGKTKFVIERENGETSEYAAGDLLNEPAVTEKLSGIDGVKVGYTAAEEHYIRLNNLKNN